MVLLSNSENLLLFFHLLQAMAPFNPPKYLKKRDEERKHANLDFDAILAVSDFPFPPLPRPNGGGWWCSWCIDLLAKWFSLSFFSFFFVLFTSHTTHY
jgi:hypothetical protein